MPRGMLGNRPPRGRAGAAVAAALGAPLLIAGCTTTVEFPPHPATHAPSAQPDGPDPGGTHAAEGARPDESEGPDAPDPEDAADGEPAAEDGVPEGEAPDDAGAEIGSDEKSEGQSGEKSDEQWSGSDKDSGSPTGGVGQRKAPSPAPTPPSSAGGSTPTTPADPSTPTPNALRIPMTTTPTATPTG